MRYEQCGIFSDVSAFLPEGRGIFLMRSYFPAERGLLAGIRTSDFRRTLRMPQYSAVSASDAFRQFPDIRQLSGFLSFFSRKKAKNFFE
ncbi:MAG: hypothetical protein IJ523_10010 [Succinivibrionaceae bacterium]|nr:hypothetical protein [Succinivibrionaceae bacterium]